jgi:hypothetical protein
MDLFLSKFHITYLDIKVNSLIADLLAYSITHL